MKELLTLCDDSPTSQYVPKNRPGQHDHDYIFKSGQRKLLVSEINFLTNYSHLSDTVLYIGASPGIHLNTLIKLFPNIKNWIFYDIHEIKVQPSDSITIINEYFTPTDAIAYSSKPILFISDIRSYPRNIGKPPPKVADSIIERDMKLQKECIENGKFAMSMLKFRMPWKEGITEYFDGMLIYEPWSGEYSPELRLITDGSSTKKYNHITVDNQMYHYNKYVRPKLYPSLYELNLKHKYHDQLIELEVVRTYLETIRGVSGDGAVQFIKDICEPIKESPSLT